MPKYLRHNNLSGHVGSHPLTLQRLMLASSFVQRSKHRKPLPSSSLLDAASSIGVGRRDTKPLYSRVYQTGCSKFCCVAEPFGLHFKMWIFFFFFEGWSRRMTSTLKHVYISSDLLCCLLPQPSHMQAKTQARCSCSTVSRHPCTQPNRWQGAGQKDRVSDGQMKD